MPRTKPKPDPLPVPLPAAVNGPTAEVFTLAEAAAYLRLPEVEVVRLVNLQDLPGRLAGAEWRFLKAAIQEWLSQPPPRYSKEAQRSVAGLLHDDPDLVSMVEQIYRRRGRPITEDGSYNLLHGLEPRNERPMIVLDTDTYSLHQLAQERVLEGCRAANEVPVITIVTQMEVLRGRHDALFKAEDGARLLRAQEALVLTLQHMRQFQVIPFDADGATEFDRLRQGKKLKKIGRGDLLIAAITLAHRATLVTRNMKDFRQVPGLQVENWAD